MDDFEHAIATLTYCRAAGMTLSDSLKSVARLTEGIDAKFDGSDEAWARIRAGIIGEPQPLEYLGIAIVPNPEPHTFESQIQDRLAQIIDQLEKV